MNQQLLYNYLCIIRACYQCGNFEPLFPLLDTQVVMQSAWVLNSNIGKDNVISYYRQKAITLRRDSTPTTRAIVELIHNPHNTNLASSARLRYPNGKLALYMVQYFQDEAADMILDLTLTAEGKIGRIDLCIPGLFQFRPYRPT